MISCDERLLEETRLRLAAAGPCRRRHRHVRRAWGHGLLSGLPFLEVMLLAGFMASAGMFLTIEPAPADTTGDAPRAQASQP